MQETSQKSKRHTEGLNDAARRHIEKAIEDAILKETSQVGDRSSASFAKSGPVDVPDFDR